jgi:DNA polymerase III subunit gamma/tau
VLDEVHMLTQQASNACLKLLEEPPKKTLWILATTNPEKLLPTIIGRCHKFKLDVISPEVMAKRLISIAKQEGTRLKDLDDYANVLKMICDLSNGRMRDAISLLESVLFGIKSGETVTASSLIKQFALTSDADIEKAAAELLFALLKNDLKGVITSIRKARDARALVNKCRWIIAYYLDSLSGDAKYTPYGARKLSSMMKKEDMKMKIQVIVRAQYLLLEAEERFNRMSLDEMVVLQATLGNMVAK